MIMNEIKSNEWFNGKLSYSSYLNVINVYIKFMKNTLNFMCVYNILFNYKYIKFNIMSWN